MHQSLHKSRQLPFRGERLKQIIIQNQTHITFAISFQILLCAFFLKSLATPACQEDPTGVNYRGNLSRTVRGHTCQAWTSQDPHVHTYTPADFPNAGLDENYCRNPAEIEFTAWCYTTDPGTRWECLCRRLSRPQMPR